jgi:hypothetical protein
MSTKVPGGPPETDQRDAPAPPPTERPSDPADVAAEVTASEQRASAPWEQASDASGAVRATREMPEPDSPGG